MYEEVSRAPKHFSVVLFLRRCKDIMISKRKSKKNPPRIRLGDVGDIVYIFRGYYWGILSELFHSFCIYHLSRLSILGVLKFIIQLVSNLSVNVTTLWRITISKRPFIIVILLEIRIYLMKIGRRAF